MLDGWMVQLHLFGCLLLYLAFGQRTSLAAKATSGGPPLVVEEGGNRTQ